MSDATEERRWDSNARQIHAEAATWIECRESLTWNDVEKSAFEAWLAASPAHMVAFLRAEDVWHRADRLRALSQFARRPQLSRQSQKKTHVRILGFGVVAATLAVVGILAVQFLPSKPPTLYTTRVGGHETLVLSDGSRIELNTNTALRVSLAGARRQVWLDRGEAFFDIRHDSSRPFLVIAGKRRIVDLGTKFIARTSPAQLEVTLVEGRARVEIPDSKSGIRAASLMPGEVAIATDHAVSVVTQSPDRLARELGWRRGVLVFDATPLAKAVMEFNRYNKHQLVVADNALARKAIDGTFRANDEEAFLEVMHDLIGLHIERKSSKTIISRAPK